jgi:hypothetical protein
MKRFIGWMFFLAPFVAVTVIGVYLIGIKDVILMYSIVTAIVISLAVGSYLINGKSNDTK